MLIEIIIAGAVGFVLGVVFAHLAAEKYYKEIVIKASQESFQKGLEAAVETINSSKTEGR